jgi:hypothetical protein
MEENRECPTSMVGLCAGMEQSNFAREFLKRDPQETFFANLPLTWHRILKSASLHGKLEPDFTSTYQTTEV